MKHSKARQIKWDLVDHLLANFDEGESLPALLDYNKEDLEYARDQIRRIARMLNVTNHISL
jgi:hypothetical protein